MKHTANASRISPDQFYEAKFVVCGEGSIMGEEPL